MTDSAFQLDLAPLPGKIYYDNQREWREEFIYFLLVDRFDDGTPRSSPGGTVRTLGSGTLAQLGRFCGGKLKGVEQHLDYIQGLGCSAIWLSPIFENNDAPDPNSGCYHGYSIQSYLDIDPRFGTKQDLVDLVEAAHKRDMRVFLDVVLNHSGDNWAYLGDAPYNYCEDQQFPLGFWRKPDRPLPVELRNENVYHRRGQIANWDTYPEYQHGDFFSLKDYNNDENPDGLRLIDALVRVHSWWIKETDIDGFRLDAVKHMGEKAVARFCTGVSEYAQSLGKRNFFTYGELIAGSDAINRYTGPNTSADFEGLVFFGLASVLDFPLYFALPGVLKGFTPPSVLASRYDDLNNGALTRGELGRYLVTFLDNHDGVGMDPKRRFGAGAPDDQIIAAIGYLLTAIGTPCIYYGTEQGFQGAGTADSLIREAMFDLDDPSKTLLNPQCRIYQEISKIAAQFRLNPELRFGRIYFRDISGNSIDFGPPQGQPCTLAFSRLLAHSGVLVAFNTSIDKFRSDHVVVDHDIQAGKVAMEILYSSRAGVAGSMVPISTSNNLSSVQLNLGPLEFVILK